MAASHPRGLVLIRKVLWQEVRDNDAGFMAAIQTAMGAVVVAKV